MTSATRNGPSHRGAGLSFSPGSSLKCFMRIRTRSPTSAAPPPPTRPHGHAYAHQARRANGSRTSAAKPPKHRGGTCHARRAARGMHVRNNHMHMCMLEVWMCARNSCAATSYHGRMDPWRLDRSRRAHVYAVHCTDKRYIFTAAESSACV